MIDKNSDRAVYLQIADGIKQRIDRGELTEGSLIESENKLAEINQVSRLTARRATDHLVNQGYLYRVRGKGTFVAKKKKINYAPQKLHGFTEEILDLQMTPKNLVVEFRIMEAGREVAEKLGITEGDMVYYVIRVRCADEEPLILEKSYLPMNLFPELNISILKGSKYTYVEEYTGKHISESLQEIGAALAGEEERKYLQLHGEEPLLRIDNQAYLEDGTIFEYSTAYFRSSKYKFVQRAKRMK